MISKEEYQEWRHHPASKVFLQFLRDKQEFMKAAMLEQWIGASDAFAQNNQTVRGQIVELGEIIDLPYEAIEEFYKEKENDAAEDIVAQKS